MNTTQPRQTAWQYWLPLAAAVAAAFFFSLKAIFAKLIYQHGLPPDVVLMWRMLLSLPVLLLMSWRGIQNKIIERSDWWRWLLMGLVGYYASSVLDFYGLQYISASLERMILYLYPTFVVLYSRWFYGVAITRYTAAALVMAYGGIALAYTHEVTIAGSPDALLGASLVFLAAMSYAIYVTMSGPVVKKFGPSTSAGIATSMAGGFMVLHFVALHPLASLFGWPSTAYVWLVCLAVFSTVLPIFLFAWAIGQVGANTVAITSNFGPLFTVFLAALLLGESISVLQLLGLALVIVGAWLGDHGRRKQRK